MAAVVVTAHGILSEAHAFNGYCRTHFQDPAPTWPADPHEICSHVYIPVVSAFGRKVVRIWIWLHSR